MSDNPFASTNPQSYDTAPPIKPKAPGGLTAILIISLVLGILGLMGSCWGLGTTLFQSQIQQAQLQNLPAEQKAAQEKMNVITEQFKIPSIVFGGLGLVVAAILLLGSIGGLNRKSWGLSLLVPGFLFAILLNLVRTVIQSLMMNSMVEPTKGMMQEAMLREDPNMAPDAVAAASMFAGVVFYVIIAVMAVWALLLIGFYIWGWTYLRKDSVKKYFDVA